MRIGFFNKMLVVIPLPVIMMTGSLNCQPIQNKEIQKVKFTTEIQTSDFTEIKVEEECKTETIPISVQSYSDSDLNLLARLIHAEAGCDWMTDELQMSVGNVVLNRVKDDRFPNSIKGVIYQQGQYACINNGMINNEPSEKAINNARRLLQGETILPENIIWQSEFRQGNGVYKTYYDEVLGNTTYLCY